MGLYFCFSIHQELTAAFAESAPTPFFFSHSSLFLSSDLASVLESNLNHANLHCLQFENPFRKLNMVDAIF